MQGLDVLLMALLILAAGGICLGLVEWHLWMFGRAWRLATDAVADAVIKVNRNKP